MSKLNIYLIKSLEDIDELSKIEFKNELNLVVLNYNNNIDSLIRNFTKRDYFFNILNKILDFYLLEERKNKILRIIFIENNNEDIEISEIINKKASYILLENRTLFYTSDLFVVLDKIVDKKINITTLFSFGRRFIFKSSEINDISITYKDSLNIYSIERKIKKINKKSNKIFNFMLYPSITRKIINKKHEKYKDGILIPTSLLIDYLYKSNDLEIKKIDNSKSLVKLKKNSSLYLILKKYKEDSSDFFSEIDDFKSLIDFNIYIKKYIQKYTVSSLDMRLPINEIIKIKEIPRFKLLLDRNFNEEI